MTQEQDIVERLLDVQGESAALAAEAAQTIAALRAERDDWAHKAGNRSADVLKRDAELGGLYKKNSELKNRVKELTGGYNKLAADYNYLMVERDELSTIVSSQRTAFDIAIRERDEARKALEPFAKVAASYDTTIGEHFIITVGITVGDLRRARDASSNREGGEE